MKNLIQLQTKQMCFGCKKDGYFVSFAMGGDFLYCPCCKAMITNHWVPGEEWIEDLVEKLGYFCRGCGIIFNRGCTHTGTGADSTSNAHVPGVWKDKKSGHVYYGSPQFESVEEFKELHADIEIIKWVCPNDGGYCEEIYPKTTHPEYYESCNLSKA